MLDDKKLKEIEKKWKITKETMRFCKEGRSIHDAQALGDACYEIPALLDEIKNLKSLVEKRPYNERDCFVCWNEKRKTSLVRPVCENCIKGDNK